MIVYLTLLIVFYILARTIYNYVHKFDQYIILYNKTNPNQQTEELIEMKYL